jgi:ABC-type bacteriocin/lantibiotic exporter with double-glycine peptidase domain
MLTNLLPVPHYKQSHAGACLPAAARMALEFLGQAVSEDELAHRLGTQTFGTPAPNLHRLEQIGFSVTYESVTLGTLRAHLEAGSPCLVFVRTGDLPYWDEDTAHALVAVGIDDESIYVNDPAFDVAPQTIPLDYFLLAWSEFDHRCAVIRRKQ